MKALIVLNLEDCTFDEIEEAGIKEVTLEKKDGGCFLWDTGFDIKPMPQELPTPYMMRQIQIANGIQSEEPPYTKEYQKGYNDCVCEILGETTMNKLEKAKEIIKEHYEEAKYGIFDSRNTAGDYMDTLYEKNELIIDICYYWGYFEVFGLSNNEFIELEEYYEELGIK